MQNNNTASGVADQCPRNRVGCDRYRDCAACLLDHKGKKYSAACRKKKGGGFYRGAVFFDMDGTLVDGAAGVMEPSQKTRAAIAKLRENGYLAALATGRAKCYLSEDSRLFDCIITSNGAHAEAEGVVIADHVIEKGALERVVGYLDEHGMNFVAEGQYACYCRDVKEYYFLRMLEKFHWDGASFRQIQGEIPIRVNKLMVTYDTMEKLEKFRRDFGGEYDITEQPVNQSSDVGMRGVSKGLGVREVMEYFGLARENTYAFGDADNDFDMLNAVGNGVAMGKHTPRLEEAACFVTKTVEEDGVFYALEHFGLLETKKDSPKARSHKEVI